MHRLTALLITVVFTTTLVFAQEQVLKSTPIYATYEAESEPQLRTAQEFQEKTIDYVNNNVIKNTDVKPVILPTHINKRKTAKRIKKPIKQTLKKQAKSEGLITNLKVSSSDGTSNVGRTSDNLTISLSGAASYNVPIKLPVGIQDITPVIGLSFSSHASNGLAGWGWNISGLSSISRIPSTKYHDGFNDEFNHNLYPKSS